MAIEDPETTEALTTPSCCPLYHEAVEMVGRRWTGAILVVLMDRSLRFSEIAQAVPTLSDRLLSERLKELEARGLVHRARVAGPPVQVRYGLSEMGRSLEPALAELERWARRWLGEAADGADEAADATPPRPAAGTPAASGPRR